MEDPATPDSTSESLTLVPMTKEENISQTQKNSTSWRGALTVDAYLRREEHLGNQGLTRDGGLTPWALVSTAVEPSQRKVLGGLESIRKRAIVAQDGQVQDVICHGVCSVFVPLEYRSKKYGFRMIQELAKKLDKWQTEETSCLFSVLYSDIGKRFYNKHGWKPYASSHVHLPPSPNFPHPPATISVKLLHTADIAELCTRDEAIVRARLAKYASTNASSPSRAAVAILPDHRTFEWHFAREEFIAAELHGNKQPTVKGALAELDGGKIRAWVIWMRVFQNSDPNKSEGNTLHITRVCIDDQTNATSNGHASNGASSTNGNSSSTDNSRNYTALIAAVLRVAQREATQWNMAEVELWNPESYALAAVREIAPKAQIIDREMDSIASLKWYGKEDTEVEWLENEKFAWC